MPTIKYIDLFAGTGGFSLALSNYKQFGCVFANDILEVSKDICKLNNLGHNFVLKDLNNIDPSEIPQFDVLFGGFPCQPFSIAGKQQGFDDERSNVFWKILEIVDYHQPKIIVLENVKNLKSHNKGETYKTIEKELTQRKYYIKSEILDTCKATNIPQHRERVYIICFKDENSYHKFNFDFKKIKNKKIKEFLENDIPEKYYYTDRFKVYDIIQKSVIKNIDENVMYQYRRYYVRENKNQCCPTLTANIGSGGHNVPLLLDSKGIRKLTPRECFNLQGFPKNYIFPDVNDNILYKLAGNAITIPIIALIAKKIVKSFR